MKKSIFISLFTILCLILPVSAFADGMEHSTSLKKKSVHRTRVAKASKKAMRSKGKETRLLSDFDLAKYQYCGQDSDCTVSFNGCCDCANGSPEVAVNKDRLEDFRAQFQCLSVACGTVDANPHCGNGVVTCVSHRCQYYR